MTPPGIFAAQLAADLEQLAALASRLAKLARAKGDDVPAASAARLMVASDKARASLEKHAAYLLNS
jgi:hypothetical protein